MTSKIDNQKLRNQVNEVIQLSNELASFSHNQNMQYRKLKQEGSKLSYQNLSNSSNERKTKVDSLIAHLTSIEQRSLKFGTPFIIYFIATQMFRKISNVVVDMHKQHEQLLKNKFDQDQFIQQKYKSINQIQTLFLKLFHNILGMCPKLFDTFCKEQMKNIEQTFIINKQQIKKPNDIDVDLEQILLLLAQIFQQDKKSNAFIGYVLEKIIKYELSKKNQDLYKQIAINWMKYQLDEARRQKQFLCCKNNFFQNQSFECFRKKFFSFKPFKFQANQIYGTQQKDRQRQKDSQKKKITEQQEQISKTITALMNQKGGAVFLGIIVDQLRKNCTVLGFQLEDKNKKQLLNYIKRIVNEVLPKHKGFEELDENSTLPYSGSVFELNYYITVQLINVTIKQTFESFRDQLKKKTYICKIMVKMGHPRYMYHILKIEGNRQDKKQAQIQFYTRSQQGNQKQTIEKCYDTIYKKLIDYQTIKKNERVNQRQQIHEGCRYDMSLKRQNLILDVNESSDQND